MPVKIKLDIPLVILGILLLATLVAFFSGVLPYPYGFIILSAAMALRALQLRNRD